MSLILWRSVLVGLGLGILFILMQQPIELIAFKLLDGSHEVRALAIEYFRLRIWAAPATLGLYALYGWFLGMQDAKIPMAIAISINLINIALDFVFVYWLNMTSAGVATASVIAQYSGLVIAFVFLVKKYSGFTKKHKLSVLLNSQQIRKFFKVNTDIFIRTLALMLTLAFFTAMSARMGNELLAVNSLMIQFLYIFSFFADGIAFAGEALVGKAYGANNRNLLKKTIKNVFLWGWLATLLISLVYLFGFDKIMAILTNDPVLKEIADDYIWWVVLLPLSTIAAFIWDGVFIGLTASKQMRNVMLISTFVLFFPAYFLSVGYFGNHSLWFAINFFMAARSLLMWKTSGALIK
jgi:MATE family multidrug resistance protein